MSFICRSACDMSIPACQGAEKQLSGVNAAIYNALMERIQHIADSNSTSTVFTITAGELGLGKLSFTAADLGVTEIMSNDGEVSEEARLAVFEKTGYDLNLIIQALLLNNPYNMFWYDASADASGTGFDIDYVYNIGKLDVNLSGSIDIAMPVAADFSAGQHIVSQSAIAAGQKALKNAGAIVKKYEKMTDDQKLYCYAREIASLVSYNAAVAQGRTAYGNPWQLIWVFDGDSATNVVCEGYTRAFQYLCDRTNFSGNVACRTVAGTLKDGSGEGTHMWNMVTMGNGKNYIVDATNFDGGTDVFNTEYLLTGATADVSADSFAVGTKTGRVIYTYDAITRLLYPQLELTPAGSSWQLTPIKVKSLKIKADSKKIAAGKSIQLKTVVLPEEAGNKKVAWKTSDKKVAAVSSTGKVTFKKKAGGKKVTITAAAKDGSGRKASIKLQCMKGIVKKVGITGKTTVKAGKTVKLKSTVTASRDAYKGLIWKSSNTDYATVRNGKVKTYKAGKGRSVIITATAADGSKKKASVKIRIK